MIYSRRGILGSAGVGLARPGRTGTPWPAPTRLFSMAERKGVASRPPTSPLRSNRPVGVGVTKSTDLGGVANLWTAAACCRFGPSQLAGCKIAARLGFPRASSRSGKRQQGGSHHGQCSPDRGFFWRWSSYSKLTLDRATVAACSLPIDDLPLEHRAGEKPTGRKTLTVLPAFHLPA
jgi:hypothetical protein